MSLYNKINALAPLALVASLSYGCSLDTDGKLQVPIGTPIPVGETPETVLTKCLIEEGVEGWGAWFDQGTQEQIQVFGKAWYLMDRKFTDCYKEGEEEEMFAKCTDLGFVKTDFPAWSYGGFTSKGQVVPLDVFALFTGCEYTPEEDPNLQE